jgi:sensor histidine kinase YesM
VHNPGFHFYPKKALKNFVFTLIFCAIIALFLVASGMAHPLSTVLVMSYSIGICIHLFITVSLHVIKPRHNGIIWLIIVLGAVAGNMVGVRLGPFLSEMLLQQSVDFASPSLFQIATFSISFGGVISFFFWSRGSLSATRAQMQEEKIKRISSEKAAVETNLRLLQAQIEPHFLFNTLSNIHSLMDSDPQSAKTMLLDLNQYLRNTLKQTRQGTTTLGKELEVVAAYLKIFKVRLGLRLQFAVDLPEDLKDRPFPPMLLQPLVENAVIHGIEPSEQGGQISIRARQVQGRLQVEIADTGMGFTTGHGNGMGLANIRERLGLIYGQAAQLVLQENNPHGVTAVIEIPDGSTV